MKNQSLAYRSTLDSFMLLKELEATSSHVFRLRLRSRESI